MDIKKIKRNKRKATKTIAINIRITKKISKWLKENDYSPTGIFYEAINDLGFKEEK